MKDLEIRHIPDDEPDEPADEQPKVLVVDDSKSGRRALMDALTSVITTPDPYAVQPPLPTIDAPQWAEHPDGEPQYEVIDESGNAELYDTSGPNTNVPVPNEQLKAKLEEQAKEYLHRLRKHNNRSAELQRKREAKAKRSKRKHQLEKASRKRNRR